MPIASLPVHTSTLEVVRFTPGPQLPVVDKLHPQVRRSCGSSPKPAVTCVSDSRQFSSLHTKFVAHVPSMCPLVVMAWLTAPEAVDRLAHRLGRPLGDRPVGPCLVLVVRLILDANYRRARRVPQSLGRMAVGFSLAMVRRPAGLLGCTVWPDSGFLARPLGGAAVDSCLDQRVYRAVQACGEQDLAPAALAVQRRGRVSSAAGDLPDSFEDQPGQQAADDPGDDGYRLVQQFEHGRLRPKVINLPG